MSCEIISILAKVITVADASMECWNLLLETRTTAMRQEWQQRALRWRCLCYTDDSSVLLSQYDAIFSVGKRQRRKCGLNERMELICLMALTARLLAVLITSSNLGMPLQRLIVKHAESLLMLDEVDLSY